LENAVGNPEADKNEPMCEDDMNILNEISGGIAPSCRAAIDFIGCEAVGYDHTGRTVRDACCKSCKDLDEVDIELATGAWMDAGFHDDLHWSVDAYHSNAHNNLGIALGDNYIAAPASECSEPSWPKIPDLPRHPFWDFWRYMDQHKADVLAVGLTGLVATACVLAGPETGGASLEACFLIEEKLGVQSMFDLKTIAAESRFGGVSLQVDVDRRALSGRRALVATYEEVIKCKCVEDPRNPLVKINGPAQMYDFFSPGKSKTWAVHDQLPQGATYFDQLKGAVSITCDPNVGSEVLMPDGWVFWVRGLTNYKAIPDGAHLYVNVVATDGSLWCCLKGANTVLQRTVVLTFKWRYHHPGHM